MKLSELKTGMVVTTAESKEFIVFADAVCVNSHDCGLVFVNGLKRCWIRGANYNEDLSHRHRGCSDLDIIRVEMVTHPYAYMDLSYDRESRILLWERDPEPELAVTMADIEAKFGCKVKIVEDSYE